MDRILMRHDDVNTFGVVLYANNTSEDSTLYKDKECTQPVCSSEARTLFPKVSWVAVKTDAFPAGAYAKPVTFMYDAMEQDGLFTSLLIAQVPIQGSGISTQLMIYNTTPDEVIE